MMAVGYGVPAPKPEPRKRVKARTRRKAQAFVRTVRTQVVIRALGRCERCSLFVGDDGHAHHRLPRSLGGQWNVDNIEYLCQLCHAKAHRR